MYAVLDGFKRVVYPCGIQANEQYFYHGDHLGSSSWITNASGNACAEPSRSVDQHLAYMPLRQAQGIAFGESFIDQRASGHDIRFKFTGKERDSKTGFDYFGARYYDSDISIWLSVDPMSDKYPSMSPYMYTAGNPVMLIDPDGRWIKVCGETEDKAFISGLSSFSHVTEDNMYAIYNMQFRNNKDPKHNYSAGFMSKKAFKKNYKKITGHRISKSDFKEMYSIHLALVSTTMIEVITFNSDDFSHGETIMKESMSGPNTGHFKNTKNFGFDMTMNQDRQLSKLAKAHEKGYSNLGLDKLFDQVAGNSDYKILTVKSIDNSTGRNFNTLKVNANSATLLIRNDKDANKMGNSVRKGLQSVDFK